MKIQELLARNKKAIIVVSVLLILAAIGSIVRPEGNESAVAATGNAISTASSPVIDRNHAYIIAKQFARRHIGKADYELFDDGFEDLGNGNFYVSGNSDIPGKHIHWTVELQYNGGEWQYANNWSEKGWTAR